MFHGLPIERKEAALYVMELDRICWESGDVEDLASRMAHWIVERPFLHQGHTKALGFLLLFTVLVGSGLGDRARADA